MLAARTRARLADLDYDFERLGALMAIRGLDDRGAGAPRAPRRCFTPATRSRQVGCGEDPATGAAAAALGGYLRELGLVEPPVTVIVRQGDDMGRPGVLTVDIPADPASGISVSGSAVPIR